MSYDRYGTALRRVVMYGLLVGVVSAVCLGVVQLLVFSCYAGSLWLGAFLVQEELIQAGEFVTVRLPHLFMTATPPACCHGYRCSLQCY